MTIEWFLKEYPTNPSKPRPRVICNDGFSISVQQGSLYHQREGEAELGFPSEIEPMIACYQDDTDNDPRDDVYNFVPLSVVNAVLAKHGGINESKTLQK